MWEVNDATESLGKCGAELEGLDDTFGKVEDSTKSYAETTTKATTDAKKAYEKAKDAAIDSIEGQIDIFSKFDEKTDVTKEKLLANLKSQTKGVAEWANNLKSLSNRGINEGLLADLKEMGPSAAKEIALLNSMSDKELKEYSKTWVKLGKETVKGAKVTTSDLKDTYSTAYKAEKKGCRNCRKRNNEFLTLLE